MMNNRLIQILLIVLVLLHVSIESNATQGTAYLSITSTRVGPYIDVSSVTTAGDHVASKIDVTQTLNYRYLDWTHTDYARIDVDLAGTIPSGMRITIHAADFHMDQYGYSWSNGMMTLSDVPGYTSQLLLYDIFNKQDSYVMNGLVTMIFYVDNFAALHPATTQLTLTYTISVYYR